MTTTTTTTRTARTRLTPDDPQAVYRLVGYNEYLQALTNLDQLESSVSEIEWDQLDEYVRRRDEFVVRTGLAAELADPRSAFDDPPQERRGLAWVTALARLELGAMLAGFTDEPRPFERVGPTSFDMAAYKELLLDGARTHYWALQNDTQLDDTARSTRLMPILSYSRRLVMVRAMLRAAMAAGQHEFTPTEAQELVVSKQALDTLQMTFVSRVRGFLTDIQSSNTATYSSERQRIYSRYCGAILEAEQRERATGKATVIDYPREETTSAGPSDAAEAKLP